MTSYFVARRHLKERAIFEIFIEPFFYSQMIYQRCSSVSLYIFDEIIEQKNTEQTQNIQK
jgi:hypothetical protein